MFEPRKSACSDAGALPTLPGPDFFL